MTDTTRLRNFVAAFTELVDRHGTDEPTIFETGGTLLSGLVAEDDWLPAAFAQPHPDRYQQYLLHCDPHRRFSVVSFVWGPGQRTPIHDHTVWGMISVLRGAEQCEEFGLDPNNGQLLALGAHRLEPGAVDRVSPTIGDIHRVSNALKDAPSISIHVYGANIGPLQRHLYGDDGRPQTFVSGYSSELMPNIWNAD